MLVVDREMVKYCLQLHVTRYFTQPAVSGINEFPWKWERNMCIGGLGFERFTRTTSRVDYASHCLYQFARDSIDLSTFQEKEQLRNNSHGTLEITFHRALCSLQTATERERRKREFVPVNFIMIFNPFSLCWKPLSWKIFLWIHPSSIL